MTPIKREVYLPVNGEQEKVVCNDHSHWLETITGVVEKEGYFFTPEQLNEYTEKVIKEALATSAEKVFAYGEGSNLTTKNNSLKWTFAGHIGDVKVDKESITNTFEQTFQKFKL